MLKAAKNADKTAASEPKDRRSVADSMVPAERTMGVFAALEVSQNLRKSRMGTEAETHADEPTDTCFPMLNGGNKADKTAAADPRDRRSVANATLPTERTLDVLDAFEYSPDVRKSRRETEAAQRVDEPVDTCFPMHNAANSADKISAVDPRDRRSATNSTLPAERSLGVLDAFAYSPDVRKPRKKTEAAQRADEPADTCFPTLNAANSADQIAAADPRDRRSAANSTLPAERSLGVFDAFAYSPDVRKPRMETEVKARVDGRTDACSQIINADNDAGQIPVSEPIDRRSVADATLPAEKTMGIFDALDGSQDIHKTPIETEAEMHVDEPTDALFQIVNTANNADQIPVAEPRDRKSVANATVPADKTVGIFAALEDAEDVSKSRMETEQDGTFFVCAGARQQQVMLDDTTSPEYTTTTQRNTHPETNNDESMEEEPAQSPPRAYGEHHRYIPMLSTLQEEAASCLTRTSLNNTVSSPILAKKMADLQEKMLRSTDRRRRQSMDYEHSYPSVMEARSLMGDLTGGGLDAVVPPQEALLQLSHTRTRTSVGGTLATAREYSRRSDADLATAREHSRRSVADESIPPMHGDELMEHMTPVSLHQTSVYDRSMPNRTGRNFTEPTYEASRLLLSPSTTSPMAKRSRLAEGATPLRLSFGNNSRNESRISEQPLGESTVGEQPSSELQLSEHQLSQTFETSLNLSAKAERAGIQLNPITLPETLQPKEEAPIAVKEACVQVHEQLNDAVRLEVERLRPIIRARMDQLQTTNPSLWRALRKVDTNAMTPRQHDKFNEARTEATIALHELLTPVMRRAGDALEQRVEQEERDGNAESVARRAHLEAMKARLAQYETFLATPLEDIEKWEEAANRYLTLKRQFVDLEKERIQLEIRRRDQRLRTIDQLINVLQTGLGDLDNIEEEISTARSELNAVARSVAERQERLAEELAQLRDD
ncbi:hypothetical protein AAVH_06566 [Aphelenchoides avenae]|nr:hypothetical protein AAVH_06566 [Aphelenchus avenae]